MVRASALRLNGEETEISLAGSENEQLFSARYVKTCLAAADPGAPVLCFLRLIRMDGVEINDDELIKRECLEEGRLQYVLLKVDEATCKDRNQLPLLAINPEQLLDPRLILTVAHKIWTENGRDASTESLCRHFCNAWKEAVLSLPHSEANSLCGEKTWLSMLELVWEVAETEDCPGYLCEGQFITYLGDDFIDLAHDTVGKTAIQFVKEKLEVTTVQQTFQTPNDHLKGMQWKLIRQDDGQRGHPSFGGLRFGLGADLMFALMEKGLPTWVWSGCLGEYDDNLLQYILQPVKRGPLCDHGKTAADSRLCIALAERFSLEEFCHKNSPNAEGQNALCLAADFAFKLQNAVAERGFFWRHLVDDVAPWRQVREVIQQQMKERIKEFHGSLPGVAPFTVSHGAQQQGEFLAERAGLWEQAAMMRDEWLRMGWTFACTRTDEQICEVVSWHFQT